MNDFSGLSDPCAPRQLILSLSTLSTLSTKKDERAEHQALQSFAAVLTW
jgi:hypothetical protein